MMKILCFNRGSSSIKCSLFEITKPECDFKESIWEKSFNWNQGEKIPKTLLDSLKKETVDCIGHRIVHGGKKYLFSQMITKEVKDEIKKLADLAPLHNLADLEGIEVLEKLFPGKPQVAVFDTSFHRTIPSVAHVYPGPIEWYDRGIQKMGFHGINYQYCTKRAEKLLNRKPEKMIICHLGSGASLCAVQNGKSIDTTMGFTPLDGLMMDTRSGSIDPGILLYLLKTISREELEKDLYERSGLLGISKLSSEMQDIIREKETNKQAKLAFDMHIYRVKQFIGSYVAALNGIDTLVFTAGMGEHSQIVREEICKGLSFLGVQIKAPQIKGDEKISTNHSKVDVLLIHAEEAFEIALEAFKLLYCS